MNEQLVGEAGAESGLLVENGDGLQESGQARIEIAVKVRGKFHSALELREVEPWPEAVNLGLLLYELVKTLARFVVLPKWAAETLALWIVHTFAFELRDVTTYIGLESPEHRCGKSTLVTVLSELANRSVVASNVSSSALFRVIEEVRPTLLIDEADTFLGGNEELRGILNSGYTRKTAYVLRVARPVKSAVRSPRSTAYSPQEVEQGPGLVRFSCWCPKVISRIGRMPVTLADRCILFRMQRKSKQEKCERLRKLEAEPLKRQCVRFVLEHGTTIAEAEPEIPAELNDREADIWEPLLVLADLAGGDWPRLAREAAANVAAGREESNPIGALLLDVYMIFLAAKADRFFSRTLVQALNGLGERTWAGMVRGKELTEMSLADLLRPYGVRPKTVWAGETSARGYVMKDFEEIFSRYMSKSQVAMLVEESREAERMKAVASGAASTTDGH